MTPDPMWGRLLAALLLLSVGLWRDGAAAQGPALGSGSAEAGVVIAVPESPAVVEPLAGPGQLPLATCPEQPAAAARCEPDVERSAQHSGMPDPTVALLEFADRMRSASPAERAREVARATPPARLNGRKDAAGSGNGAAAPVQQLRLAIVLGQIRPGADLARAQQLAQQVVNSAQPEAQPIKPLARLLVARFAEQRRLEEQLERAERQLRDQRQRLARATQRLEAVRAIERSLGPAPAERPTTPAEPASAVPAGPR